MLRIYICGQKYPALELLKTCIEKGHRVIGVCTPKNDAYIRPIALQLGIPLCEPAELAPDNLVDSDIGLLMNHFHKIPNCLIPVPKYGFAGYHPSLLPRHRGRSSIEWAIAMKDNITGGSIYWLNPVYDGGSIAYQRPVFILPELWSMPVRDAAAKLWREHLMPVGIDLFKQLLDDLQAGKVISLQQDERAATFEPPFRYE